MNYRYARIPIVKLLGILVFLVFCLSAKAQDYIIENYAIDLKVSTEGYYDITEKIDVHFNERRRGIIKNIPLKYKINGKNMNLKLSNVTVRDHEFALIKEGNGTNIRIGNKDVFLTGAQSYIIDYRYEQYQKSQR